MLPPLRPQCDAQPTCVPSRPRVWLLHGLAVLALLGGCSDPPPARDQPRAVAVTAQGLHEALSFATFNDTKTAAATPLTGYFRTATVSAPGIALADHPVLLTISGATADFWLHEQGGADLRIFDSEGDQLPYFYDGYDSNAETARVWVRVPSIPPGGATLGVYYGNAALPAASDGSATFPFFDGFDGSVIDDAAWAVTSEGDVSVAAGVVTLSRTEARLTSRRRFDTAAAPMVIETRFLASNTAGNGVMVNGLYDGGISNLPASGFGALAHPPMNAYHWDNGWPASTAYAGNWGVDWTLSRMTFAGAATQPQSSIQRFSDGATPLAYTRSTAWSADGDDPIVVGTRYDGRGFQNQAADLRFDWIRTRPYVALEPTVSLDDNELPMSNVIGPVDHDSSTRTVDLGEMGISTLAATDRIGANNDGAIQDLGDVFDTQLQVRGATTAGDVPDPPAGCTRRDWGGRAYYFCTGSTSWSNARSACIASGAELVNIGSGAENTWVLGEAQSSGLTGAVWTGGQDLASDNNWLWSSDRDLFSIGSTPVGTSYTNWNGGEPNGGSEDCVELYVDVGNPGTWNDGNCGNALQYVCETLAAPRDATYPARECAADGEGTDAIYKFTASVPTTMRIQVDNPTPDFAPVLQVYSSTDGSDPITRVEAAGTVTAQDIRLASPDGANCSFHYFGTEAYYFCSTSSTSDWQDARDTCAAAGMALVRIESAEENDFLGALTAGIGDAWIGAYDRGDENNWRWLGDIQFWEGTENGVVIGGLFNGWNPGSEPNDSGIEDCATIGATGLWNDTSCSANDRPFLCEVTYASSRVAGLNTGSEFTGNHAQVPLDEVDALQYPQASAYGNNSCNAHAGDADAMFTFTLAETTTVDIDTAGTGFAHTVGLWNYDPQQGAPALTGAVAAENDRRSDASVQRGGFVQSVTVTNGTGVARSDEFVGVTLSSANANFWATYGSPDSLRVRDQDGEGLPYYISAFDGAAQTATIWALAATVPVGRSTFGLYYGDATLPAGSLGAAVQTTSVSAVVVEDAAPTPNVGGDLNGQWLLRTADLGNLDIGSLNATSAPANNTNGEGIVPWANLDGDEFTTTAGTTSGLAGTYPNQCGTDADSPDAVYKFTAGDNTTVRIGLEELGLPPGAMSLHVYDGTDGAPLTLAQGGAVAADVYDRPDFSNVDEAAIDFTGAPSIGWACAGTVEFNSDTYLWSSADGCAIPSTPGVADQLQAGGPSLTVVPLSALNIGASTTLRLVGSKPVTLIVSGLATVDGTIDASASGTAAGAGGNWNCGTSAGQNGTGSDSLGGGGGGGGAFGTAGGSGGDGGSGNPGAGGVSRGSATLVPLIGGCPGGQGGGCGVAGAGGGGAVQLAAASVTVAGTIITNGGDGILGCGSEGGGTGGGSGGGILIEGLTVSITGSLLASAGRGGDGAGGGAGGSGSTSPGAAGAQGQDHGTNGAGGGGGGYGRTVSSELPFVGPDTIATARAMSINEVYQGTFDHFDSTYVGTVFDPSDLSNVCSADSAGPDAFYAFTVSGGPTEVTFTGESATAHTLALFDGVPVSVRPAATPQDTDVPGGVDFGDLSSGYQVASDDLSASTNMAWGAHVSVPVNGALASGYESAQNLTPAVERYTDVDMGDSSVADRYTQPAGACGGGREDAAGDQVFTFSATETGTMRVELTGTGGTPLTQPVIAAYQGSNPVAAWPVSNLAAGDALALDFDNAPDFVVDCAGNGRGDRPRIDTTQCTGGGCLAANVVIDASVGGCGWSALPTPVLRTMPGGGQVVVVPVKSLTVTAGSSLRLIGDKPVILIASGDITVDGEIDASANYDVPGAGGNVAAGCATGTGVDGQGDGSNSDGASGGGGGGYQSAGGGGGQGDSGSYPPGAGGGSWDGANSLAPLAGGCAGGRGGDGQVNGGADAAADGGAGGGGFQLSAIGTVSGAGSLRAEGGGGRPGSPEEDAGGGGGSGGTVLVEGGAVSFAGTVRLHGGGGASGCTNSSCSASASGQDGYDGGAGGNGSDDYIGDGGAGATVAGSNGGAGGDGTDGLFNDGAGGGGGGGGFGRTTERIVVGALTSDFDPGAQVGCSVAAPAATAGVLDFPVVAGNDYTLHVTSAAVAGEGTYDFDLIWATAWSGCDPDPYGADGYVDFDVAGRTTDITVESTGSAMDTVVALFDSGGVLLGCSDSGAMTAALPVGLGYRAVVRAQNGSAPGAFELGIHGDPAVAASMACADSGAGTASLTRTLADGTYYVAVSSQSAGGGDFAVRASTLAGQLIGGSCTESSVDVPVVAGSDYYVVVKGDLTADAGSYDLNIKDLGAVPDPACGDPLGADAYFEFDLSADTSVEIDISQGAATGSFRLYDSAGSPVGGCIDDAAQSYSLAAAAGPYFVRARANSAGTDTALALVFKDASAIGSIDCMQGASGGGTITYADLPPGDYHLGLTAQQGAAGDSTADYRVKISKSLLGDGATYVTCGTGSIDQAVVPGTDYYVVVKGDHGGEQGDYGLTLTDVGINNDSFCNGADDQASADAFFTFDAGPTPVRMDVSVADGYVYQLYEDGTDLPVAASCDTGATSYPDLQGAYYLRARGQSYAAGASDGGLTATVACGDSDADGTTDCNDSCPADPGKIAAGVCGCGVSDVDTDLDGFEDCTETCIDDPGKQDPGVCGCGTADGDSDGDGTDDCQDSCPLDAGKLLPGHCGCGSPDTDADVDGILDCDDCDFGGGQCGQGEGICDEDADCTEGLVCAVDAGALYGLPADHDVCVIGRCNNGVQDYDEQGIDCGTGCPGSVCVVCEGDNCELAHCSDGIPSGDEWGLDCGGSCALPCNEGACDGGVDEDADGMVDCEDIDCVEGGSCAQCTPRLLGRAQWPGTPLAVAPASSLVLSMVSDACGSISAAFDDDDLDGDFETDQLSTYADFSGMDDLALVECLVVELASQGPASHVSLQAQADGGEIVAVDVPTALLLAYDLDLGAATSLRLALTHGQVPEGEAYFGLDFVVEARGFHDENGPCAACPAFDVDELSPTFCTTQCACQEGEGGCATDADCEGDLVCVTDAGGAYGLPPTTDVCQPDCNLAVGCSAACPCDDYELSCGDDSECVSGTCGDAQPFGGVGGLCIPASCADGIQNNGESAVDCGTDACGPCNACEYFAIPCQGGCVAQTYPDGTTCGAGAYACEAGACTLSDACGDGRLDNDGVHVAPEQCDDGNNVDGDGCSADCRATRQGVADLSLLEPGQYAHGLGVDGHGKLLFAWQTDGSNDAALEARRAGPFGRPAVDGEVLALAGVGLGSLAEPAVAGLTGGGWVVVWTDDREPAGVSHAAFALVTPDGTVGAAMDLDAEASDSGYVHQQAASVAARPDGFVAVWVHADDRDDGLATVRARLFDQFGVPDGDAFEVAGGEAQAGIDQRQPSVAAFHDDWMVTWTNAEDLSVRGVRYRDRVASEATQLIAADAHSSALAALPTAGRPADFAIAWTALSESRTHAMELFGDSEPAFASAFGIPDQPGPPERDPAVTAFGRQGFIVGHQLDALDRDIDFALIARAGRELPAVAGVDELRELLQGPSSQSQLRLTNSSVGVWFTWYDDGLPGGNGDSLAAYLLGDPDGVQLIGPGCYTAPAVVTAPGELSDSWEAGFGGVIAVDGSRAVVAATGDDGLGKQQGDLFAYDYENGSWTPKQTLTLPSDDPRVLWGEQQGRSLALEGATLVAGAPGTVDAGGQYRAGAVHIYADVGGMWLPQQVIASPVSEAGARFGAQVALVGDGLLISAPGANAGMGQVYAYRWNGNTWTYESVLAVPPSAEAFGRSLSSNTEQVLIGGDDGSVGTTLAFSYDGMQWTQDQSLAPIDGLMDMRFGVATASDDDVLVVLDSDMVIAFEYDGASWSESGRLPLPAECAAGTADSISVEMPLLAFGCQSLAFGADPVFIYQHNPMTGGWAQYARVADSRGRALGSGHDATSVQLAMGHLLYGAPHALQAATPRPAGVVHAYSCNPALECGDGIEQDGEQCDDGNNFSEQCDDGMPCEICDASCQRVPGHVPVCGDGIAEFVAGLEACDDGNVVTETCAPGTSCEVCDATCQWAAGEYCGDGFAQLGEDCDDGNVAAEYCGDLAAGCTVCGDACSAVAGAYCGDGFVDAVAEACDDINDPSCSASCASACQVDADCRRTGLCVDGSCTPVRWGDAETLSTAWSAVWASGDPFSTSGEPVLSPDELTPSTGVPGQLRASVTEDGRAFAAWVEDGERVMAAIHYPGWGFRHPQRLNAIDEPVDHLDLASGGRYNAVVGWSQQRLDANGWDVLATVYSGEQETWVDAGGEAAAVVSNSTESIDHLSVDAAGDHGLVTWVQHQEARMRRGTLAGFPGAVVTLAGDGNSSAGGEASPNAVEAALAPGNRGLIAWVDSFASSLEVAEYDGTDIVAYNSVQPGVDPDGPLAVAIAEGGRGAAAANSAGAIGVSAVSYDPATGFGAGELIELPGSAKNLAVATDAAGHTAAVWNDPGGPLQASALDVGTGNWTAPTLLDAGDAGPASIAIDPIYGHGIAVWATTVPSAPTTLNYATYHPVSGWSSARELPLRAGAIHADAPQVAVHAGQGMLVWRELDDQMNYRVAGTRFVLSAGDAPEGCGLCACNCAWGCNGEVCADPVAIAGGWSHFCALRSDGAVSCWGQNTYGQLGDGTTTDTGQPVGVRAASGELFDDVVQLSAGRYLTCALRSDGTVWCWGRTAHYELGVSGPATTPVPTMVALPEAVTQIASGMHANCAVMVSGRVYCWGREAGGQLGNGVTTATTTGPAPVIEMVAGSPVDITGITKVVSGAGYFCALRSSGGVYCWGNSTSGPLGTVSGDAIVATAEPIIGIGGVGELSSVADLYAGQSNICAIFDDASMACWGSSVHNQLGQGPHSATPVMMLAPGGGNQTGVVEAIMTYPGICMRLNTGEVRCQGTNWDGRLGDDSYIGLSSVSVAVTGLDDAVGLASSAYTNCAVRQNGEVVCWGQATYGQTGGELSTLEQPATEIVASGATDLALGCYLDDAATVHCWGVNEWRAISGQPGPDEAAPVPVYTNITDPPVAIDSTRYNTCVRLTSGVVECWGLDYGRISDQYVPYQSMPYAIDQGNTLFEDVWLTESATFLRRQSDGQLLSAGYESYGRLGYDAAATYELAPGLAVPGMVPVKHVSSYNHTCAVLDSGALYCWGRNLYGALGDNTSGTDRWSPGTPILQNVTNVAVGTLHSCAIVQGSPNARAYCWGWDGTRALGDDIADVDQLTPVEVALDYANDIPVQVAASAYNSCAIVDSIDVGVPDGRVMCWGTTSFGMRPGGVGYGPQAIPGVTGAVKLVMSKYYQNACALIDDGSIKCWGKNQRGNLGAGWFIEQRTPVRVAAP